MGTYVQGGRINEYSATRTGYLPVISQNFTTPADYFRPGAELPGNARNRRFMDYQDLYDGESHLVVDERDYPIAFSYFNWFSYGANLVRDFLLSKPPESTAEIQDELNRQLGLGIVSYVQSGVAIFAVDYTEDGQVIETIKPQYFYPLDDGTYATVTPYGPNRVVIRYDTYSQMFDLPFYDDEYWYDVEGTLGDPVSDPEPEPERQFFIVQSDPNDGIYGNSVFREVLPSVSDYTEISSQFLTQQKIGSLIIVANRASGDVPSVNLPTAGKERSDDGEDNIRLAQLYGSVVEGYESFNFVQGSVSEGAYRASVDMAVQSIYDTFGISPSLAQRFQDTGMGVASGVALERTYVRSAATFSKVIERFKPVLNDILESVGQSADIEWNNPLAALREDAEVDVPTVPEE